MSERGNVTVGALALGAVIAVGTIAVVFGGEAAISQDRVLRKLPFRDLPV